MKVSPICTDTFITSDPHVWIPRDFSDFIRELENIVKSSKKHLLVFRGHSEHKWLLECTFVRNCKKALLGIEPYMRPSEEIRNSVEYNQALFSLFLLKFDLLVIPSEELKQVAQQYQNQIDPHFELFKRYQQYPKEDKCAIKGTFFLDWSEKEDVALFFANYDSGDYWVRTRQTDGALFICDATATGKTFMRTNGNEARKVKEIVELMVEAQKAGRAFGCPLLFHPPMQIRNDKANNQAAVYFAQMDLRYDLEEIWYLQERDLFDKESEFIYLKLILPYEAQSDCAQYLHERKITHAFLFPDQKVSV